MSTNKHARDRVESGHTTPPAGNDRINDESHALRAGKDGSSQRKQPVQREQRTRDPGSDDRRSGSESGKS